MSLNLRWQDFRPCVDIKKPDINLFGGEIITMARPKVRRVIYGIDKLRL